MVHFFHEAGSYIVHGNEIFPGGNSCTEDDKEMKPTNSPADTLISLLNIGRFNREKSISARRRLRLCRANWDRTGIVVDACNRQILAITHLNASTPLTWADD